MCYLSARKDYFEEIYTGNEKISLIIFDTAVTFKLSQVLNNKRSNALQQLCIANQVYLS